MRQKNTPKVIKSWPKLGAQILENESTIWIESLKFLSLLRLATVILLLNFLVILTIQTQELIALSFIISLLILFLFFFYRKKNPITPIVSFDKKKHTFSFRSVNRIFRKEEISHAEIRSIPPIFYNRKVFEFSILTHQSKDRIFLFDWQSERDEAFGFSPVHQMRELAKEFSSLVGIKLNDRLPSQFN